MCCGLAVYKQNAAIGDTSHLYIVFIFLGFLPYAHFNFKLTQLNVPGVAALFF